MSDRQIKRGFEFTASNTATDGVCADFFVEKVTGSGRIHCTLTRAWGKSGDDILKLRGYKIRFKMLGDRIVQAVRPEMADKCWKEL